MVLFCCFSSSRVFSCEWREVDPKLFVSVEPSGALVVPSRDRDAAVQIIYKRAPFGGGSWLSRVKHFFTAPRQLEIAYKGEVKTGIGYHQNRITKSYHFHTLQGRVAPDSAVVLVLWHGIGADYSHSGSWLQTIKTFSGDGKTQKKLKNVLRKNNTPFVSVSAEAMDLPLSGHGPPSRYYRNLDATTERLVAYLQDLRSLTSPNVKLVVLARSASIGLIGEINHRYPGLVDGVVMMGPLHPDSEHGFKASQAVFYQAVKEKMFKPNWEAFHWVNAMYADMTWHKHPMPFGNTPTLILIGSLDPETPIETRRWFSHQGMLFPSNVQYLEVANASHNIFSPHVVRNEKDEVLSQYDPLKGYVPIYTFLNGLIDH